MKTKFRFLFTLLIAIGMIGFTASCSSDDNGVASETEKTVTVAVNIAGASNTRVAGETANGITPELNDVTFFFCNATNVLSIQSLSNLSSSSDIHSSQGGHTFRVPNGVNRVYAIGNAAHLSSPTLSSVIINSPISAINAIQFEMDKQTDPKTDVNLKGSSTSSNGSYTAGIGGAADEAALDLVPAIARIEIKSVNSIYSQGFNFKLDSIYINNTYTKFPYGETLPTTAFTAAEIINNGKDDGIWGVGSAPSTYPVIFSDDVNSDAAATHSLTPTGTPPVKNVWGYFVPATEANALTGSPAAYQSTLPGTIIDAVQYNAVPHIILKISGVNAAGYNPNTTYYVTVRGYTTTNTTLYPIGSITNLFPGHFYIMDIEFGTEHLSTNPEDPTKSLKVKVTVKPWQKVDVTPVL